MCRNFVLSLVILMCVEVILIVGEKIGLKYALCITENEE